MKRFILKSAVVFSLFFIIVGVTYAKENLPCDSDWEHWRSVSGAAIVYPEGDVEYYTLYVNAVGLFKQNYFGHQTIVNPNRGCAYTTELGEYQPY